MGAPLLLIPPLTQLNTPYPATAYLSGFLKQQGYSSRQGDLGLDMVLEVFHQEGLKSLFDEIVACFSVDNLFNGRIISNRRLYEQTIDDVIAFYRTGIIQPLIG